MNTNRFSLLEIDTPATAAPAAPAMTAPVKGEPKQAAQLGSLDQDGRARAIEVDAALRQHGLAFSKPTFFAWGTRGAWGDKAARARAELHAMPLHRELEAVAREIVAKEQRRGDVTDFSKLAYAADDRIRTKAGSAGAPCSPQALKQILLRAEAPGGGYLTDTRLPGSLRAPHVTHWLDARNKVEANILAASPKAKPQQLKLLSKIDSVTGQRALYGAVGPRYPHEYGMDKVIADVASLFPGEARGTLHYDEATTRWKVDAAVGAEFEPVVGDVYRLGVRYGAHDAGIGSYYAELYGIRVRCVNFTKIRALKKLGRVRHIGSIEELRTAVKALAGLGADAMSDYSAAIREANESAICERALAGEGDAKMVFRALIEGGYLPAPGGPEVATEAYFNAWLVEPGHNRLDFVNAATRAAHESAWSSPWVTEEIEEAASNLLYQRLILTEQQVDANA